MVHATTRMDLEHMGLVREANKGLHVIDAIDVKCPEQANLFGKKVAHGLFMVGVGERED